MTSQKSLKNNVRTKDFLRSLVNGWIYPAIALIVLFFISTYPVIKYVISEQFVMSKVHSEISVFLTQEASYVLDFTFLPIGMVICGMITAIRMFSFMMRKNQTNVYFSMGISRMSLYFNRIAAGSLMLFLAVLIPISITYFINIGYFGISTHLTQVYLYIVSLLFVSGLSGLAIGAMMSTVSGNVFEAGAGSIAFSLIGLLASSITMAFCDSYLKGYVPYADGIKNDQWPKLFSPWTIGTNLSGDKLPGNAFYYDNISGPRDLVSLLESTGKDFKIPDHLKVDMGFIIPVLIWLGISVLLIALGAFFMKKRKAENAKSFGKFAISRVVFAIFVFLVTILGIYSIVFEEFGLVKEIAILIGVTLVVHFITQLILTRNFKRTLKSLPTYAVLLVLTIITLTAVNTQVFGLYNKTPKAEEIKSVSIDVTGHPALSYYVTNYNYESIIESSDKKDIDTAINIFELIKKDSGKSDSIQIVHILFEYKDGSKKVRAFPIYTDEIFAEYEKTIYNSSYFDKVLETMLLKEPVAMDEKESEMYSYAEGPMYTGYEGQLAISGWHYVDSSVLLAAEAYQFAGEEIAADKEFYQCLYNDLSKMTYEELFKNESRPLGVLSRYASSYPKLTSDKIQDYDNYYYHDDSVEQEPDRYGSMVQIDIPIYPQMTETLKYLNENGYEPEPAFDGEIKEVLYTDSPIATNDAVLCFAEKNQNTYHGYGKWEDRIYVINAKIFSCDGSIALDSLSQTGLFIDDECSSYDMLIKVYNEAEHPLKKLDLAKSEQVLNNCVPFYSYYNDNGRFVYVIYENGIMMAYYLPQAKTSVLQ